MGKKRKELSHEEIWDDSGLIESWDLSYEEYKKYHSIHARGENVKELLAQAEREEEQEEAEAKADTKSSSLPDFAEVQPEAANGRLPDAAEEKPPRDGSRPNGDEMVEEKQQSSEKEIPGPAQDPQTIGGPRGPEAGNVFYRVAEASSQDENLKNLMMSWYWAGYYTGLYEGQKRASEVQATNNAPSDPAN